MTDGTPSRGFATAEYEDRLERAQRRMRAHGLDALLLTTEPEFRYFSGFLTKFWESPTRPWFLLVPKTGMPVAVVPEIGRPLIERSWIEEVRSWPAPTPEDEGVSLLASTIRETVGGTGAIGVPMGPETTLRMPMADWNRLGASLPSIAFQDASPIVVPLRMVKSDAEIEKIEHICGIASAAFDRLPSWVEAGMPLTEVFRSFEVDLLESGADGVPYLVGASEQDGYADVISPPTDRPVRRGDLLMMDTGAVWDGYFCDFDRNVGIGVVSDACREAYATLHRATDAGLSAVAPGVRAAEVFDAMHAVIEAAGYAAGNVGRFGHGLGMSLTEWPSLTPSDDTTLEPGVVLTLEPGLEFAPGRGMVHEENLVVTSDGPRLLSARAPEELPVIR